MPKYVVRYEQVTYIEVVIEAENEEAARLASIEKLKDFYFDATPGVITNESDVEFNCVDDYEGSAEQEYEKEDA